jgi:hypothetical protein
MIHRDVFLSQTNTNLLVEQNNQITTMQLRKRNYKCVEKQDDEIDSGRPTKQNRVDVSNNQIISDEICVFEDDDSDELAIIETIDQTNSQPIVEDDIVYKNPLTDKVIKKDGAKYNELVESGIQPVKIKKSEMMGTGGSLKFGNFVARMFNDQEFKIHQTSTDGNCLFDSASQALGVNVSNLREQVAQLAPLQFFDDWKILSLTGMPEYEFMVGIETPEQLSGLIMNEPEQFWGDEISMTILETCMDVRFLLMDGMTKNVRCNYHTMDQKFEKCVLVAYTGQHYRLVSYKGKKCFNSNEVPIMVKNQAQRVYRNLQL